MTNCFSSGAALPRAVLPICIAVAATLIAGCSSRGEKADRPENPFKGGAGVVAPRSERELRLEADQLYRKGHDSLVSGDYEAASQRFTEVISKYPFTDFATQAELEKIYAQYRSFQPDEAVTAADRFLREHPRHPNVDYIQYVKGLTDFERDNRLVDYLPIDSSKRDVLNARRAYDDFALLLQKYPTSRYAGDARKRMIYLRNRIAAHEVSVVRFYVKRGAWVAASKRAENIIFEFPGAPATADALLLLQQSYEKLGLKPQIEEVRQLVAANDASFKAAQTKSAKVAPLSLVDAAPEGAAVASAPATAEPEPRRGFFGRIGGLLDSLNKSYTVGEPAAATPSTPIATNVGVEAPGPTASEPPASLTTGPNSGRETVITIPAARADGNAAATAVPEKTPSGSAPIDASTPSAASAVTAPAAAAAAAPAKPKSSIWSLDFLNKSYTIGGSKKKDAEAAAPKAPDAAAPAAPAEAKPGGIRVYLDYGDEDAKARKKAEDEAAKVKAGSEQLKSPAAPPADEPAK